MRRNSCHGRLGRRTRHQQSRALAGPPPRAGIAGCCANTPRATAGMGGCGAYGAGQWPVPIMLPCQRTTLRPTSNSNTHQSAPADAAGGSPAEARSTARGMDAIPSPDRPRPISWGVFAPSLTPTQAPTTHLASTNSSCGSEGGREAEISTPSRAISSRTERGSSTQPGWSPAHPSEATASSLLWLYTLLHPLCPAGIRAMAEVEAIPAAAIMIHKEADLFLTSLK